MRVSKIKIKNFPNFSDFEIDASDNVAIVGENKVGKSNLVFTLQLILDPGVSECDCQLGLELFWDGLGDEKLGATIEIAIELTDYENDPRLLAHLGDRIVDPGPPMMSRLTYRFQPKVELEDEPSSLAGYDYIIFGGLNPDSSMRAGARRMLPLDVLGALRDAEKDLATWRRSPLRPLIEALTGSLDGAAREEIQEQVDSAQTGLADRDEVKSVAEMISARLVDIVGPQHATPLTMGRAPTRIDAPWCALRILIDDGSRGISDASLGIPNLIFLALKSLELDRLVEEGERGHTFLAVEKPEAHLRPLVQRLVYRHFLKEPGGDDDEVPSRLTTVLTTHSPHIASVAPIRSIVLLHLVSDCWRQTLGAALRTTSTSWPTACVTCGCFSIAPI